MARSDGVPLHIVAPGSPMQVVLPPRLPDIETALRAPEREEWAGDAPPLRTVPLVMLAIDRRGGSVLLADRMAVGGIPKRLEVGRTYLRRTYGRGRTPSPERIVDDGFRRRRQNAFGKRFRLGEQRSDAAPNQVGLGKPVQQEDR